MANGVFFSSISLPTLIVGAIIGFGIYLYNSSNNRQQQQQHQTYGRSYDRSNSRHDNWSTGGEDEEVRKRRRRRAEESTKECECVICLEELNSTSDRQRLYCGHEFHKQCIQKWMLEERNCPVCRALI